MIATKNGYGECVKTLLKQKVDVNAQNSFGETALHFAAIRGHSSIIQQSIDAGAKLELIDDLGNSPLNTATQFQRLSCVQSLLSAKSNTEVKDNGGITPLRWSQILDRKDMENLLQSWRKVLCF